MSRQPFLGQHQLCKAEPSSTQDKKININLSVSLRIAGERGLLLFKDKRELKSKTWVSGGLVRAGLDDLRGFSSRNHSLVLQSQSPQRSTEVLTDISTNLISAPVTLFASLTTISILCHPPQVTAAAVCLQLGHTANFLGTVCPCLCWVCQELLPRLGSRDPPSHTAQQANLSSEALPCSYSCCQERDSSDPNKLEI